MKKLLLCIIATFILNAIATATPLTGTYNIPGDYATISAAISDLNTFGVDNGGVIFNVAAGYTESVTGLSLTTTTTIDNTHFIIFQKAGTGANPKVTASGGIGASDAAIAILGSSYVTFDGIDIGVSGSNVEYGYYLQNSSATNGSQNNTIKNCQITLNNSNNNSIGIYQNSSITATSAAGANSYNVYHKITIDNSFIGIYMLSQAAFPDLNCIVDSCKIGTYANSIGGVGTTATWGIRCDATNNTKVFGCEVSNITMTGTKNIGGLFLSACTGSCQVFNNKVHDLKVTGTSTNSVPIGIRVEEPAGNTASVYNNMVWGFSHGATTASGTTILCRAISINSQNGYTGIVNVYYNTAVVAMGAPPTNIVFSVGYGLVNVKDNIFYNTSTAGAGSYRYCYYAATGTLNSSDNNDLYIPAGTNNFTGNYAGSNKALLSDWVATTGMDANSISSTVTFVSSSNLHLNVNANCAVDSKGAVTGITNDIDNDTRDLSTPDIGADEFISVPPLITSTTPDSLCGQGSVTLQTTAATGNVEWWDAITAGNKVGSGNSFITSTLTTTTNYFVDAINGTCTSSPRIPVTATIISLSLAPTGVNVSVNPVCNGNSTDLTVSGGWLGARASWKWYSGSCGLTPPAGSGASITVAPSDTSTYYVRAEGYCNTTSCDSIKINVIPVSLATPGPVTGNSFTCMGVAGDYSISSVPAATNYTWSFPPGWTINSGQGSVSANATAGGAGQSGDITVTASNPCATSGTATFHVTVNPGTPIKPWDIIGYNPACAGVSAVYSTPAIPGASDYTWTFPSGWTITSGQGDDTIVIVTGGIGDDGNIVVNAGNSCGTSNDYSIAVTTNLCTGLNIKLFLEGLYTGAGTMKAMTKYDTINGFIPKWGFTIADTIGIELHDTANYSHIVYRAFGVPLKTNGTALVNIPGIYNSSYFITIKHRNHLPTTTAAAVSFATNPVSYNFTDSISKAYGSNMRNIGGIAVIYAGDITSAGHGYPDTAVPDGVIDISDVYYIFNSYLNGDFGYLLTDISGDGTTDLKDVYLAFNNYLLGIYARKP